MELVYPALARQTFKDVEIISQIVEDDGLSAETLLARHNFSDGGAKVGWCEEYIRNNFPQIKILKPGYNIGFARGHNEIFASTDCEYYQLVNPDLILEPDYIQQIVKTMDENPQIGAATGKLLQYNFDRREKTNIIDTTGIVMSRNGRARDRGQHEADSNQYDRQLQVVGVSGAGPMYRKSALEEVKMPRQSRAKRVGLRAKSELLTPNTLALSPDSEYFDEDFHSYWEDTDLTLRMQNRGFQCLYVPNATGYHGRTAGSSKKGYKDVSEYRQHHGTISQQVKQLNYKNHMFVVVKNFPGFYWKFFVRECFMLEYVAVFEIATLKILPSLFRQLPRMLKKRKWIKEHRKSLEWVKLLNNKGLLS